MARIFDGREKGGQFNPLTDELSERLKLFQKKRISRINALYKVARLAIRLQARDGLTMSLMGRYILPYLGDKVADWASRDISDGAILEFLPHPERSGSGWQKYSQKPKKVNVPFILAALTGLGLLLTMVKQLWEHT